MTNFYYCVVKKDFFHCSLKRASVKLLLNSNEKKFFRFFQLQDWQVHNGGRCEREKKEVCSEVRYNKNITINDK